jgi:hypothetical protein
VGSTQQPLAAGGDAVAAVALCLVEGAVGASEQLGELDLRATGATDSERGSHPDRRPLADVLDSEPQLLGDVLAFPLGGAGEQDEELLAADPVDELELAQAGADLVGDFAQDPVADVMAGDVVDALEVIEVEEDEGDRGGRDADLRVLA